MKFIATIAAGLLLAGGVGTACAQEWELSTDLTTASISINGIAGAETGEAWAALAGYTGEGKIFYYDGTDWTLDTTLYPGVTTGELRDLYVDQSGDRGYVLGNDYGGGGHIWRFTGGAYTLQTSLVGGSSYLYSAYAPDSDHAWVGGSAGNVYYTENQGTTWTVQTNFGAARFVRGLSGTNSSNVWALAGFTAVTGPSWIYRWDGSDWSVQTQIDVKLYDITAAGAERALAGGYYGLIYQYDDSGWSFSTDVGNPTVNSIAAGENDKAWAGLSNGAILYFNGSAWSVEAMTSSSQGINKVAVSATGEVWAGAVADGKIYRRDITPLRPWIYDYNGDGTSDIAVFRESSGLWAVRGVTRAYFGTSGDTPAPGDFDGDGTTEIAVFRPGPGLWAARGLTRAYFGASGDRPLPADFAGDGTADVAIFRADSGLWAIRGLTRAYFGASGDIPIPGDYTAEGNADITIFRPSTGLWAARGFSRVYFGQSGDNPVPAAYDGGGTGPGIFRPSSGLWALMGRTRFYFGQNGDEPLPAHYWGSSSAIPAVFRGGTGLWAIRGYTRIYFGGSSDIPLAR